MDNIFRFNVSGKYALFTDPLTKIGGEKSSLMIPTYQSLKGICESIYWKPSVIFYIDSVNILNPIRTESKGIRPINYSGGNDLSYYTYLTDVSYNVTAHFEFNRNRLDLKEDFNENKHYFIMKRCIEKGGRRDIFLGARECQGYVEPAVTKSGYYASMGDMEFGLMYHSLSYPDENGQDKLIAKFWRPKMVNGTIEFCRPEDCEKEVFIKDMEVKKFSSLNFSNADDTINHLGELEGGTV